MKPVLELAVGPAIHVSALRTRASMRVACWLQRTELAIRVLRESGVKFASFASVGEAVLEYPESGLEDSTSTSGGLGLAAADCITDCAGGDAAIGAEI